jgi:predicted PurR-regulated permease PerM
MVMIEGLVRVITRRAPFLPAWAGLPLALLISTLVLGLTAFAVAGNAGNFGQQLITAAPRVNELIAQVAALFGVAVPPTLQSLINQLNPTSYIGQIAAALQGFTSGAVYVLIYLGFLIASRQGFAHKAHALFPDPREREHASTVFIRIRNGMERYLWIQAVTGAVIAVACWAAMATLGLHSAGFWAFLIFIVTFIPVLGGLIASVLPPLFALLQFEDWWHAVGLFVALQVILFVVGNVVLPKMQKDSLNIDPVVVLLSLAIWGALWGVVGMFLSTPLTVMAIIILTQFPGTRWIAILLSGDGEPQAEPKSRASKSTVAPASRKREVEVADAGG